jgi:hypothetical protein
MPFLVGIIPGALLLAVATYPVTLVLWEWVTKSVHAAREHRLALAAAKKSAAIKNQPPL